MSTYYFSLADDGSLSPLSIDVAPVGPNLIALEGRADIFDNPLAYRWSNDHLVALATMVLHATVSGSVTTVTATLTPGDLALPTTLTFSVAGQQTTVSVINSVATLSLIVHPALTPTCSVVCSVSGQDCAPASIELAHVGGSLSPIQWLASTPPVIAPTTKAQVREWLFGLSVVNDPDHNIVTDLLQEAYTSTSVLMGIVVGKLLPALTQPTYTPITLSADEQHALADLTTNLLPTIDLVLGLIYPSAGSRVPLYQHMIDKAPLQKIAIDAYQQVLEQIPNLA